MEDIENVIVISMFQFGEDMIDAQASMRVAESQKREKGDSVFGGQYGLGLKQFLGVIASLEGEGWMYDMFGTVMCTENGVRQGWSRFTPRNVNNSLVVEGRLCWGSIRNWVRKTYIYFK